MPANRPYVVGLTGGTGCGKSEAARYLATLGALHVDADEISRALTAEDGAAIPEIRRQFGEAVFDEDGRLNRRALADLVFANRAAKLTLESIIHPLVQREVLDRIDEAGKNGIKVVVLDVPLLFECGMDVLCDETWTMSADESTQLARIRARDGLSEEQARARVASQLPMNVRNARAKRVIDSARPIEKTRAELMQLYRRLL